MTEDYPMRWRRFSVIGPPDASEAVCAIMQRIFGGLSVTPAPEGLRHDAYMAELADYASAADELAEALGAIPPELALPAELVLSADWVDDEDWAEAWKKHYQPMRVGQRLVVVRIDPGMAFGTGAHSSTRLCMIGLKERVRPGVEVIDLGCGSGILTITALKLGAADVLSIDNDPICISATASNAAHNGVDARCRARIGEGLADIEGRRDIIVANITADVVISQAPRAVELLKPGGCYIISGFTVRSAEAVAGALRQVGLSLVSQHSEADAGVEPNAREASEESRAFESPRAKRTACPLRESPDNARAACIHRARRRPRRRPPPGRRCLRAPRRGAPPWCR